MTPVLGDVVLVLVLVLAVLGGRKRGLHAEGPAVRPCTRKTLVFQGVGVHLYIFPVGGKVSVLEKLLLSRCPRRDKSVLSDKRTKPLAIWSQNAVAQPSHVPVLVSVRNICICAVAHPTLLG